MVSSSWSPGGSSVLSVVVSVAVCKTFGPIASEATFTVAAPGSAVGPCLFTYPVAVTASRTLHYTRNSSCVILIVLKSSGRSHIVLQQFVLMILITDSLEIIWYIWSCKLVEVFPKSKSRSRAATYVWATGGLTASHSVKRQLVSAALCLQRDGRTENRFCQKQNTFAMLGIHERANLGPAW